MCGIAGRTLNEPGHVGDDLVAMMAAQRHRGWDSTGFALYGPPRSTGYVVRALLDDRAHLDDDLEAIRAVTREHGADFVEEPTWDESGQKHVTARFVVSDPEPFSAWVDACDALPRVELQSAGRALEIVKDIGDADEVADKHDVREFIGTHGYYIDVTAGVQSDLTRAMATVVESRAVIDQAKGVLMAAYGIDADRAFDILKWRSQDTQVKLRTVASRFMEAVIREGLTPEAVTAIDHLLLADPAAEEA